MPVTFSRGSQRNIEHLVDLPCRKTVAGTAFGLLSKDIFHFLLHHDGGAVFRGQSSLFVRRPQVWRHL